MYDSKCIFSAHIVCMMHTPFSLICFRSKFGLFEYKKFSLLDFLKKESERIWKCTTGWFGMTDKKYWLITRARNNFRGATIYHFFTVAWTFGYLFFSNQSWFLFNFNNTKLLKAWYWRCKKRPLWIFEVWWKSAQEPPILDSCLFFHTRQLI